MRQAPVRGRASALERAVARAQRSLAAAPRPPPVSMAASGPRRVRALLAGGAGPRRIPPRPPQA
eukprot:scaffold188_cov429-Prasinococcus_capsulatus_cf.AAC.2